MAMKSYFVEIYTGDMLGAGTSNWIKIKLLGSTGTSESVNVNSSCLGGFWRGSVHKFEVKCPASIGSLLMLELKSESLFDFWEDEWFCSKIIVTSSDGDMILFPCYRWLSSKETLVFRDATAKLIFQDTQQAALEHRSEEIKRHKAVFRWSVYAPHIPHTIKADSPEALPDEIRFSFSKKTEFQLTAAFIALQVKELADRKKSWESFQQLDQVFCDQRTSTYEYVRQHWREDEFFGYQFLNGLNPIMIQRCSELPKKFPVTDDMVKASLPAGSNLQKEMEKGNIFLCDYKRLRGLKGIVIHKEQQYLTAPLCLLYSNPEGKLLPIAIQLNQDPGEDNPIFLPSDSEDDWLLAKTFVRSAEFGEHELNVHLLRTHLLAEVFTVATLRNLPGVHPLFKLLIPHTRYTLHINIMARNQLISEDGLFAEYVAIGLEGTVRFLKRSTSSMTYTSICLPDDIKARGVEKIPNYYYRDDGLKLWDIINKMVRGVVSYYYTSDADVQKDSELQLWINDIFTGGFLENDDSGIPQCFSTVSELIKFVTMVIFTVSAQHAAVNSGQFDFGGWMPNFPSTIRCPPPISKGGSNKDILDILPDISTTVNTMAALYVLSKTYADRYQLGHYPEDLFNEDTPLQMISQFQEDLKNLEATIEKRNRDIPLPYTYLCPKNVDNSVSI